MLTSLISWLAPLYSRRPIRMLSESWRTRSTWFHTSRSSSVGCASEKQTEPGLRAGCCFRGPPSRTTVALPHQASAGRKARLMLLSFLSPDGKRPQQWAGLVCWRLAPPAVGLQETLTSQHSSLSQEPVSQPSTSAPVDLQPRGPKVKELSSWENHALLQAEEMALVSVATHRIKNSY